MHLVSLLWGATVEGGGISITQMNRLFVLGIPAMMDPMVRVQRAL
jgi:hypothetical protein